MTQKEPEEEKYIRTTQDAMDAMKDLDVTEDERDRFSKAFKDPEFLKMFVDYANEISDPAARAEQDAYLKQIENEGRTKEVYGDNVELITPTSGFVIKTHKKENNDKVFINVCYSDKVKAATSTKVKGGENWDVPYSLSAIRKEKDNKGNECDTHDFVIGNETYEKVRGSQVFRKFICQTAIENVQKQRYGQYEKQRSEAATLSTEFKCPTIKFKGPKEGPSVLAVKDRSGLKEGEQDADESASGRIRPQNTPSSFNGIDVPKPKAPEPAPVDPPPQEPETQKEPTRSGFSFDFNKNKKVSEVGEVKPKYEIVHRGQADLQEAWSGTADNRVKFQNTIPKAIVVRVALPRLDSIAGVDLDVSKKRVLLVKPDMYRLDIELPFEVDDAKGKAKFDKTKKTLELVLPVIPPPPPPSKPFVEVLETAEEEEEETQPEESKDSQQEEQAEEAVAEEGIVSGEEPPETSEPGEQAATTESVSLAGSGEDDLSTEARLKASAAAWDEMMRLHDEKQRAAAAARQAEYQLQQVQAGDQTAESNNAEQQQQDDASRTQMTQEFHAASEFTGQHKGYVFKKAEQGLGYYKDKVESQKYGIPEVCVHASEPAPLKASITKLPANLSEEFYQASEFVGQREGYVFKLADKGLGYYKDQIKKFGASSTDLNEGTNDLQAQNDDSQAETAAESAAESASPPALAPRLFAGDVLELD